MDEPKGGGFCDIHGPYDPPHTSCPYCAAGKGRPQPPPALEDELPTEFPEQRGTAYEDDDVTQWPSRRTPDFDDDFTQIDVPEGSQEPLAWLVIGEGPRRGHIIPVTPGQSIGRKGADIVWDDPKISRMHARITLEDGKFYLWDFGTANGTFVNDERIRAATEIQENDKIKLGDTLFVFKTLS